jgi:opacity protein-like surface antigen
MRRVSFILAAMLAIGTASAEAQTPVTGPYAEFTTGGAGAGALFGAEVGYGKSAWEFFFETGRMLNTKSADMDAAAELIANQYLGASGKPVTFETRQPVNYYDVGARYKFPTSFGRVMPYAALGLGGASVSRSVTFEVAGVDVTNQLPALGVSLGGDLSGSEGAFFFMLGGGAELALRGRFFVDLSYRYGHAFISEGGTNTHRFQVGIGGRF